MLKIAGALLILIHGLIQLLGFAQAWHFTKSHQLSGYTLILLSENTAKAVGVLWLLTSVCFLIAFWRSLTKREWWWIIAAAGVAISQILIILYWPDAKAGTIVNMIVLVGVILAYAQWSFNHKVKKEVQALFAFAQTKNDTKTVVTQEMLTGLPACVQQWLQHANVIGKEEIRTVRLKQKGMMRTSPEGKWMPVQAEQYFTIDQPAFIWQADITAAPFLHIAGRDKYVAGQGNMLIKMLSLIPVANSRGKEVDQGTLLRFLAEMVWYPTAALSNYIQWEAVDATSARATMIYGGVTASLLFRFNEQGDIIHFEAQRYMALEGTYSMKTWCGSMEAYTTFHGVRIPVRGALTWKLKTGDFTWFTWEITDIEYNKPTLY